MKKHLVLLLCMALASAAAQTAASKPSAAKPAKTTAARETPAQPEAQPVTAAAEEKTPQPAAEENPASAQPETAAAELALPVGTTLRMKLETPISTQMNKAGDKFAGRVIEPLLLNGKEVVPVGTALEGVVLRTDQPRRIRGTPTIALLPQTIVLPSGERFTINATIVDTSARPRTDVNDEGQVKGRGRDGRDWKETGIASGVGAVAGGVIAGGEGALVGAGVGATASVVHWLAKRRTAELPAGTEIIMELSRPMTFSNASNVGQ